MSVDEIEKEKTIELLGAIAYHVKTCCDGDEAKIIRNVLHEALDDLQNNDFFGTDGSNDPRGADVDQRVAWELMMESNVGKAAFRFFEQQTKQP